jgi:excisionase family DNA binding protein
MSVGSSPTWGTLGQKERMVPTPTEPRYLRTAQVAELLHVSPKTVSRWAQEGRLPYLRTLGGHRRYPDAEIRALVETLSEPSTAGQPLTWSP